MGEVSLALKFSENMSSAIVSLKNKVAGFERDLNGLTAQFGSLSAKKIELKTNITAVTRELSEAKKAFRATGDEAALLAVKSKETDLLEYRNELALVGKQANETQKQINSCGDAISKADNRAGARGGGAAGGGSLAGKLGSAGLYAMAGQAASQMANTFVGSAFGDEAGSMFASALSQAGAGAAIGSMLGLGIPGAIVGGIAGGAVGLVSGAAQNYEKKDDAFKEYNKNLYDTVTGEQQQSLVNGSQVAGGREQTQMAFAKKFGSETAADVYLEQVKEMAKKTNYTYDEITGYSKKLLNSYDSTETLEVLTKLSDATAGLNLDSNGVDMFINGLSRMRTTGKVTQEYLNYFGERGLDVYGALADSTGADKKDISGMVTRGDISGETAAQAILDYIDKNYGGLSEELATTYKAKVDNLGDVQADMDAANGEGYNNERKKGIDAQMEWYASESGKLEMEANRHIGEYRASLENLKEKMTRDAKDEMYQSEEYKAAQKAGDGAELARLDMLAEAKGVNQFNATEEARAAVDSNIALAAAIRDDTAANEAYYDAGYRLGKEFDKGRASGMFGGNADTIDGVRKSARNAEVTFRGGNPAVSGYALGLERVPYDNFPALLHEGEQVLPAREARSGNGGGISVSVTGNEFHVRQESDIDAIATALVGQLKMAKLAGVAG